MKAAELGRTEEKYLFSGVLKLQWAKQCRFPGSSFRVSDSVCSRPRNPYSSQAWDSDIGVCPWTPGYKTLAEVEEKQKMEELTGGEGILPESS